MAISSPGFTLLGCVFDPLGKLCNNVSHISVKSCWVCLIINIREQKKVTLKQFKIDRRKRDTHTHAHTNIFDVHLATSRVICSKKNSNNKNKNKKTIQRKMICRRNKKRNKGNLKSFDHENQ